MLFNSFEYAIFLPVVFLLYWFAFNKSFRQQNILLLAAGYFFYGWWDYRFLGLLFFSTFLDFASGRIIDDSSSQRARKTWLITSVVVNLGLLGFFKYYNFFVASAADALTALGFQPNVHTLQLILPIGISFYTFHGLSYVFDVYNGKISSTRNFADYAVFVCFFPLLVAGPIERATHLLPQVKSPRIFSYDNASEGMRQILWGLFKKVVIADSCAPFVNSIFANYEAASTFELASGAVLFAFQIYGDFSGYSDIALGSARLLGFDLMTNFRTPYFSRDIAEFWRRWHISLSSWFRDYVYIPLGGSKRGPGRAVFNTVVIFVVSGFWHGANWTFIVWGALNALYFIPLLMVRRNRQHLDVVAEGRYLPSLKEIVQVASTFAIVCFAWIFFRADSLSGAFGYIGAALSNQLMPADAMIIKPSLAIILLVWLVVEWLGRVNGVHTLLRGFRPAVRYSTYAMLLLVIGLFGVFNESEFIYFQF